jgi:hypothetical protein
MSSSINRTVLDIQESFSTMLEEVHLTKLGMQSESALAGPRVLLESITLGLADVSRIIDERQRQIIQWLSTLNPEETHTSIVRAHKQGTSDWIIHSDEFISWYAAERSFLWLSGFRETVQVFPSNQLLTSTCSWSWQDGVIVRRVLYYDLWR